MTFSEGLSEAHFTSFSSQDIQITHELESALEKLGLSELVRAEELSLDDYKNYLKY
mgnify:CR=1 FL=1